MLKLISRNITVRSEVSQPTRTFQRIGLLTAINESFIKLKSGFDGFGRIKENLFRSGQVGLFAARNMN